MTAPHPEIDAELDLAFVTETRAEVAYLSESRASLLDYAAGARTVILASGESTRLTYPLREALLDAGGRWVVREPGGTLRDGVDGYRLTSIDDAIARGPITHADDVAEGYLRSARASMVHLVVSLSVRHRSARTTVLGGPAQLISEVLTGAAPTGWGLHEPALVAWDRHRLTEVCRRRMPRETTLIVVGAPPLPVIGTVRAARTAHGLEETTQLVAAIGAPGSEEARHVVERLPDLFAALSTRPLPLFGFVTARTGRDDLTLPSTLEAPASPLGMLLGPPGVRELDLDGAALAERFGGRVLGRPRTPGLYVPLGGFDRSGGSDLDAVLDAIGRERVHAALAVAGSSLALAVAGGSLDGTLRAQRP